MVDLGTLKRARELCAINEFDGNAIFENNLENLDAQLSLDVILGRSQGKPFDLGRHSLISTENSHVRARLGDLFTRIHLMDSIWQHSVANSDMQFYGFGGLAIKDVHVDIAGVLDAVAPVAILSTQDIKSGDHPGLADILPGSNRSCRDSLPGNIKDLVDDAMRWVGPVRKIRHILAHRDHERIVFGNPTDRRRFQVYERGWSPKILDHFLLVEGAGNIVDLDRYLAFIWAEMNVFLDSLGTLVADHLGLKITGQSSRSTTATFLITELDQMLIASGSG